MKKFFALFLSLVMTFQLAAMPAWADTLPEQPETTPETTAATEPASVDTPVTEAATEATEQTTEPVEETVPAGETVPTEALEVMALQEDTLSGTCGEDLTWTLSGGVLTISGTGKMTDFQIDGQDVNTPWYEYRENVLRVVIESGVTGIGSFAFYGCTDLAGIAIPQSVTDIGSGAFAGCISLTGVTIPGGVTSIGDGVFNTCSSLTGITIPEGVTSIGATAFRGCSNLTGITIPGSVTSIGDHAFQNCDKLTSLTIPGSVTNVGSYAFSLCPKLADVTILNGTVGIGREAFWGCTSLTGITIPKSVTTIDESAFSGCNALETVNYGGTESDWAKITIGEGNQSLTDATILCSDDTAPDISGTCGENLTWTISGGTMTISGTGKMDDYADDSHWSPPAWYDSREKVNAVVIAPGVTGIGGGVFYEFTNLTSVTIPQSVTSIGNEAFYGCTSLERIVIPQGVTVIGPVAFGSCSGLTDVSIPESVITIGRDAFSDCTGLTGITIPEGVTSLGDSVFSGCTNLASIFIPKSLTSIGDFAFDDCVALATVNYGGTKSDWAGISFDATAGNLYFAHATIHCSDGTVNPGTSSSCGDNLTWAISNGTLTISGTGRMTDFPEGTAPWYTSRADIRKVEIGAGVTSIGSCAFLGCINLTDITIADSVTGIGAYAFQDCVRLTGVDIPGNVTYIDSGAFYGCTNLASVTIPEGVTTIGGSAFRGCRSLTGLTIPGSVTSIGDFAFYQCSGLTDIVIPEGVTSINRSAFSWCTNLASVTIPGSVKSIGSDAFGQCGSLTAVTIPQGVTSIGEYAFNYCTSLTSVTIPDSVTSIGDAAFYHCDSLTGITIPQGVTSIGGHAFGWCKGFTSITIPDSVTSIGDRAFYGCTGLTGIAIPDGVTGIGDETFNYCSSLTEITLPKSVTSIGDAAFEICGSLRTVNYGGTRSDWAEVVIGENNQPLLNAEIRCTDGIAIPDVSGSCGSNLSWILSGGVLTVSGTGKMTDFRGDGQSVNTPWYEYRENIRQVVIESGVTGIGSEAFSACTNLTDVSIPDSVTAIGDAAFYGCRSLTGIALPGRLTRIGAGVFSWCTGLTTVTIPKSVAAIGDGAFNNCTALETVYYGGTEAEWAKVKTGSSNDSLTRADIACTISGTCGTNLKWTLSGDGTLTISGKGKMEDCYDSDFAWRSSYEKITQVIIEPGVTSIGVVAFVNCTDLTSIAIPEGVTSIGESAFNGCSNLTSITLPDSVTSIEGHAFQGCSSLTDIVLPDRMTSIGTYAFHKCSMTEIVIPEGITRIEDWTFTECTSLTSVTIPEGVTSIGEGAFLDCRNLTSVSIPKDVTTIGTCAFFACRALETVEYGGTMDDWDRISIDSPEVDNACLSQATIHCSDGVISPEVAGSCGENLTWSLSDDGVLTISGAGDMAYFYYGSAAPWHTSRLNIVKVVVEQGVTSIGGHAFTGCINLTDVSIADSVTAIGHEAFTDCVRLAEISIPDSVTDIGVGAFSYCESLVSVNIPEHVRFINPDIFLECNGLTSVSIPDGVTGIGQSAFAKCRSLTSVNIPDGVTSIDDWAFVECESLTNIDIPNSVTNIGNSAFYGCSSLTSVNIPNSVTSIGSNAFYECSSLTSITIPDGVARIEDNTFSWCESLTSINIPNSVTSIGENAFYYCHSLTSVTIPDSVTDIGNLAFYFCSSLTDITVPQSVASIGSYAFSWCESLASIAIPDSVTSIGDGAFYCCPSLSVITIPDSVDSIGSETFSFCTNLTEITMPKSVTSVGDCAFFECTALKTVYYSGTKNDWKNITIGAENTCLTKAKLVCAVGGAVGELDWNLFAGTLTLSGTGDMKDFSAAGAPWYAKRAEITSLTVAPGVTGIGEYAFSGCTNLTAVTIADSVTRVSASAFSGCTGLADMGIPSLAAGTLDLNAALTSGVTVDLTEGGGNRIESASLSDERFTADYDGGLLTVHAGEDAPTGSRAMTLEVLCADGRTYTYPVTLKVTRKLPAITVRQTGKFNSFYRSSEAVLTVTAKDAEVENVELLGNDDFIVVSDGEQWLIRYADPENAPARPVTKGTLSVTLAGYAVPVTKSFSVSAAATAPSLKLSASSATLFAGGELTAAVDVLYKDGTPVAGENLTFFTEDDTAAFVSEAGENTVSVELTEAKTTTVKLSVQGADWVNPVKLTYRVNVSAKLPTIKLGSTTLKLNSVFTWQTTQTTVTLNQSNMALESMEFTPADAPVQLTYDPDTCLITASVVGDVPKSGRYAFTYEAHLAGTTQTISGKLTVSVAATVPKVTLSATSVRLNRFLAGDEQISVTAAAAAGYEVTGFEGLPEFVSYESGVLTTVLPDSSFQNGSYTLYPIVRDLTTGQEVTLPNKLTFRVQTYNSDKLGFSASAKGKLDTLNPDSEIVYTVKLKNCVGDIQDVELTGADADKFEVMLGSDGTIRLTMADGETYATNVTYKAALVLTVYGREITGSTLSIRVSQSALKVTVPKNLTYDPNESTLLCELVPSAPLADAVLSTKTAKEFQNALGRVSLEGNAVIFEIADPAALTPGKSYTVCLDVTPENNAENVKPTTVRLTVKAAK